MIRFNRIVAVASALMLLTGTALAANTVFFTNKGDIAFPFVPPTRTAPGTINNTVFKGALGTFVADPSAVGAYPSYTFSAGQRQISFTSAATASYAYVTLASGAEDGNEACIFAAGAITALYLVPPSGESIVNAVTALTAGASACYRYSLSNTTWYRTR